MKALVKQNPHAGLWMQDVAIPEPGSQDVRIRVTHSAICGSDVHIYNWDEWAQVVVPTPMVVGHEFCGVIEKLGSDVTRFQVGQRVSAEGHIVCGTCRNCRAGRGHLCRNTKGIGVTHPGSFAEYIVVPQHNVFVLPEDIPDELAAIFDPLGNAVHTALSFDLVGEDVLVTGAGPIGIMGALVAQSVGARKVVITDIIPYRLDLCRKLGVQYVVDVGQQKLCDVMSEIGITEGFDVGLEMSGAAMAMRSMIDMMNYGGKIAILGISPVAFEIDWNKVIFKLLHLKGISGREMFETWYKMTALVQSTLDVTGVITHRFGIDDFEEGFAIMRSGQSGKVILQWDM
ncbi:MAG: L-threonine 3-dehydrogenase [Alphaproteobacteria bacterium]|nr:L-threonine 3-dehydrogenase [Alphaproteobacteria bacterium]